MLRSLTLPEYSLLGSDVSLQLGSSDVDADGLRQVTDGLRYNGLGCVAGLQAGRLQPNVFTLVSRDDALSNKSLRTIVNIFFLFGKFGNISGLCNNSHSHKFFFFFFLFPSSLFFLLGGLLETFFYN